MTRCVYCQNDQGRRECPALGGLISTACCGQHRGLRIDCPPHCRYFKAHEEYRRERLGPEFHRAWLEAMEPFYRDRQTELLDFVLFLELSIYQYFLEQTRGSDEDLSEALEFLKRQLSPIQVIETPGSTLGRHLSDAARQYNEKKQAPSPEQAQAAVDGLLSAIESLRVGTEPRRALHGLLGHVERYIGVPEGLAAVPPVAMKTPKIVWPGQSL